MDSSVLQAWDLREMSSGRCWVRCHRTVFSSCMDSHAAHCSGGCRIHRQPKKHSRFPSARTYMVAFVIGFGSIGLASYLATFSFLGRHLAFLLPLLFGGIYVVWDDALKKFGSVPSLCFASCFLLLWGVSCFICGLMNAMNERTIRREFGRRSHILIQTRLCFGLELAAWEATMAWISGGLPSPSTWKKVRHCIDLASLRQTAPGVYWRVHITAS